jgi:hypothetical protein
MCSGKLPLSGPPRRGRTAPRQELVVGKARRVWLGHPALAALAKQHRTSKHLGANAGDATLISMLDTSTMTSRTPPTYAVQAAVAVHVAPNTKA